MRGRVQRQGALFARVGAGGGGIGGVALNAGRAARRCAARLRGAAGGQRVFHGVAHGLVHLAAVAKAHFDFGGVHVHVHAGGIDLHVQQPYGLAVAVQHVFIGAAGGVADDFVAHVAAIDPGVLLVGAAAGGVGQARAARHAHAAFFMRHGQAAGQKVFAQHVGHAPRQRLLRRQAGGLRAPLLQQLAFMPQGKAHVGPRQRVAAQSFHAVRQFGGVGLEEFAPRGHAEEKLFDLHGGAARACGLLQLARARLKLPGAVGPFGAREQRCLGHGGNGRQRFAAKAHRAHRFQIVQAGDLAGGVALERRGQLRGFDAAAVVFHGNEPYAAGQQAHGDLRGPGVQRVVQQLAHDRGGALDDFAGRNLADEFVGQFANGAGRLGGGHG